MKKIFKEISLYSLPFLGLIILLIFINIIKKDFTYGHYLHSTYKPAYNWLHEIAVLPINKFFIKLKNDKNIYAPQVKLYASQSSLNSLLEDLPNSTKIWKKGKIVHDSDKKNLKDVQLRFRGDNPENWLLEKKHFRIKFRKNEMNGRQRYYNYLPFEPRILISNTLAKKSKLIAPKVRPIELILNEEKKGLYLELEHFNENFLRRNKIMPVNFYKGENYNQEIKIGLGNNLYSNIGLWSKEAYFNFYEKEYNSDLKNFLRILKQSKNDSKKFQELKSFFDQDYIGRYLAYLIISQNYHISKYHNNRIIFDTWKGQVFPVITDPDFSSTVELNFERSSNDLTSILNQSSEFLNLKYKYLNEFIFKEKILINEANNLNNIKLDLVNVLKNDPTKINIFSDLFVKNKNFEGLEKNIKVLKERHKILKKELMKTPTVVWTKNYKNFSLILDSKLPINDIELLFENDTPEWVFIDENYNNIFDSNEVKFFKKGNKIKLNATLFSNRINLAREKNLFYDNIIIAATKFNFISSNDSSPSEIKVNNVFLEKQIPVDQSQELNASQTNQLNKVLFNLNKSSEKNYETLSGTITVDNQITFTNPVKIKPGTTFLLNKNSNIIFKNKVEAIGTIDKKITFKANTKDPWGTVALIGKDTNGSVFNFVNFSDGSGNFSDQYTFTSMFSIHNTSNIKLKNIELKNNHFFDDMMHIIYSSNIILDNLIFRNAFGDALDIDISYDVKIFNSNFYNSKNDGIDLMESKAAISNVNISNSKDKAISVGESSNAKLSDSKLEKNEMAVAVKDNSKVLINNVIFQNNKNQINAYKKNLQYGSGGTAKVFRSSFEGKLNNFLSKDSSIVISESNILGSINKTGTQIFINER